MQSFCPPTEKAARQHQRCVCCFGCCQVNSSRGPFWQLSQSSLVFCCHFTITSRAGNSSSMSAALITCLTRLSVLVVWGCGTSQPLLRTCFIVGFSSGAERKSFPQISHSSSRSLGKAAVNRIRTRGTESHLLPEKQQPSGVQSQSPCGRVISWVENSWPGSSSLSPGQGESSPWCWSWRQARRKSCERHRPRPLL